VTVSPNGTNGRKLEICIEFESTNLQDLAEVLLPAPPLPAVRRLEALVREAQCALPSTKEERVRLVDTVNSLLDAHKLRLQLVDGSLARLMVDFRRSNPGTILFSCPGIGPRGFLKHEFRLVHIKKLRCQHTEAIPLAEI